MAVVTATASRAVRSPERTCVGCRQRAATTELLRVVAVRTVSDGHETVRAEPDPRRRAPGRGAWVHPDPDCVRTAERRRAFARALRVPGALDAAAVADHVRRGAKHTHDGEHDPVLAAEGKRDSGNEPSMKRQQ